MVNAIRAWYTKKYFFGQQIKDCINKIELGVPTKIVLIKVLFDVEPMNDLNLILFI